MTEADILACAEAALAKWQSRVHLMDWVIGVEIGDTTNSDDLGMVKMGHTIKRATVALPSDLLTRAKTEYDFYPTDPAALVEQVVLHELLHVTEQPWHSRLAGEITWAVGEEGAIGADLRTAYLYYREHWINSQVRILIEADRSGGWTA